MAHSSSIACLAFDENDLEQYPFVDRGNGIKTQTLFQNGGPGGIFLPYGLIGKSNHMIDQDGSWASNDNPHIHGGGLEELYCRHGSIWVRTMENGVEVLHLLFPRQRLLILSGTPHWGGANVPSFLETTMIAHREYKGTTC